MALKIDSVDCKQSLSSKYCTVTSRSISLCLLEDKEIEGNPVDVHLNICVETSNDIVQKFILCKGCNRCFENMEVIQSVHGEMRIVDKLTSKTSSSKEITLTLQPHSC